LKLESFRGAFGGSTTIRIAGAPISPQPQLVGPRQHGACYDHANFYEPSAMATTIVMLQE
jgi:hypothetical protein